MTTYYVRKDGNDTTGDGSTGTPWLTIQKAMSTMSTAGGHTLKIGAGTYAEDSGSGFFDVYIKYTAASTYESESGAQDVIITGASHASYDTLISGAAIRLEFKNIIFQQRVNTTTCAVRCSGASYITFTNCLFSPASTAGTNPSVSLLPSSTNTVSNIIFSGCTFTQTAGTAVFIAGNGTGTIGAISLINCTAILTPQPILIATATVGAIVIMGGTFTASTGISLNVEACTSLTINGATFNAAGNTVMSINQAHATMDLVSLTNVICTASGAANYGCIIGGVISDLLISGGTYTAVGAVALKIGEDAVSLDAIASGEIIGVTTRSTSSHALLIGGGCVNLSVSGITSYGGDYAVVVKENSGTTITSSHMTGGSTSALYFKAATNSVVTLNTILNTAGVCVQVLENAVSGNRCQNITLTNNKIYATGSAGIFNWGGDTADVGGGVCDYNTYKARGSAKFKAVRADDTIETLAELRAAWADYDVTTNDSHSKLYDDGSFLLLFGRRRR